MVSEPEGIQLPSFDPQKSQNGTNPDFVLAVQPLLPNSHNSVGLENFSPLPTDLSEAHTESPKTIDNNVPAAGIQASQAPVKTSSKKKHIYSEQKTAYKKSTSPREAKPLKKLNSLQTKSILKQPLRKRGLNSPLMKRKSKCISSEEGGYTTGSLTSHNDFKGKSVSCEKKDQQLLAYMNPNFKVKEEIETISSTQDPSCQTVGEVNSSSLASSLSIYPVPEKEASLDEAKEKKLNIDFLPQNQHELTDNHFALVKPGSRSHAYLDYGKNEDQPLQDNELDISFIVAKKIEKRNIWYLVRLMGLDDSSNRWIHKKHLSCDQLIDAFEAAIAGNILAESWTVTESTGTTITLPPNICRFFEMFCREKGPAISAPPLNFTAINETFLSHGISRPINVAPGCNCSKKCQSLGSGCSCFHHQSSYCLFPTYAGNGILKLPANHGIYECNRRCKCPPNCKNRVVQHGRQVKIQIFKTMNKGWGVRALQSIKKGSFIIEYVGEIITSDEAEMRGQIYDTRQATYLFDLDFEHGQNEDCAYTIDACRYGNSSHFFNHSCDPNMAIYSVFIDSYSTELHHLAFFATKDIEMFQELTFDYLPQGHADSNTLHSQNMYRCHCGAEKCRGFFHRV
ncbi:hypothetical protein DSO57_1011357 [Entomophthora muscae]|uniref:Uncharacterized protein n=1 Tax=Entomophthora muscae TaxID=34485 RepID=A0ACC2U4N1_9FUNG|nr:hypothetical protein DSO57_1011357 [Entomophthora muscae]